MTLRGPEIPEVRGPGASYSLRSRRRSPSSDKHFEKIRVLKNGSKSQSIVCILSDRPQHRLIIPVAAQI